MFFRYLVHDTIINYCMVFETIKNYEQTTDVTIIQMEFYNSSPRDSTG